jgi:hypothetical protein
MRVDRGALALLLVIASARAEAQSATDGPVLVARPLRSTAALKAWVPDGHLRLVAWDRDSIVVRGRVARGSRFFFSGDSSGAKLGVEQRGTRGGAARADIVAYIPRRSMVSVKTVTATIDGAGASGWFYSVSGAIHLAGRATSIEVESMDGALDLDVTTPWLRARTGAGHLLLRGAPEDVDVSTISGILDVAATTVRRGQFGSVSGDIHFSGAPADDGIVELSNHSGDVELLLPAYVSGVFTLSSILGPIENGFARAQATASTPRTVRVSLGRGGAQVSVRTFRGAIRLRRQ